MCLNPFFGIKITFSNLSYRNSMRYSILVDIIQAKLIFKRIIWSKRAKNVKKTHFCVKNVCLKPIFGNKVTFINLSYHNSMRYSILVEIIQAKLIFRRNIWSKRPKNVKKTLFCVKNVCSNPIFGNKVTFFSLSYRNSMRYSILVEIIQTKLISKRIIWSKRPKNVKKHIFCVKNVCLNPIFGNKVTFVNLSYRNSVRYSILVEIIQVKLILKRIIWSKRSKNAKKH